MPPEDEVPEPQKGWGALTADDRVEACLAQGMWGGACPPDWEIGEAELYAIFKYLQRVVATSARPEEERVLVVSDSQTSLDKLEEAWRAGDARDCVHKAGGALVEAICGVRARLGTVVMVYCPAHRGVAGNEAADAVAKAHLDGAAEDTAAAIAPYVTAREGLTVVKSEYGAGWVHTEKKFYRQVKHAMGAWVHRELLKTANSLMHDPALAGDKQTNYGQGRYCTEVLVATARGHKLQADDGEATWTGMQENKKLVRLTHELRGRCVGLPHERGMDEVRCEEVEEWEGVPGAAPGVGWAVWGSGRRYNGEERCRAMGCMGCASQRRVVGACPGCGGWIGRPEGAAPYCQEEGCPGAAYAPGGWRTVGPGGRTVRQRPGRGERGQAGVRKPPRAYETDGREREMETAEVGLRIPERREGGARGGGWCKPPRRGWHARPS